MGLKTYNDLVLEQTLYFFFSYQKKQSQAQSIEFNKIKELLLYESGI